MLELAFILDKNINYYVDLLKKVNAINVFCCETHDIYYTDKVLDGMIEEEMKKSCVRFRVVNGFGGTKFNKEDKSNSWIENYNVFDNAHEDRFFCREEQFIKYEELLLKKGYRKVFDTKKKDYQFKIGNMKSMIQLQEIDNIGLVLYYDNPDYFNLEITEQKNKLVEELNSYGFELNYSNYNVDKLRSLYYGKIVYNEDIK
jgi:hypothetical protein